MDLITTNKRKNRWHQLISLKQWEYRHLQQPWSSSQPIPSFLILKTYNATDELRLHNDRSVDMASAQKLEHSMLSQINHRSLRWVLCSLFSHLSGNQTPHLIQVHRGAVQSLTVQMEVSHTDLSEVTRMANNINIPSQTLTTYRKGYEHGANLQPYHVPKDGNDAFLEMNENPLQRTNTSVTSTDVSSGLSVLAESSRLQEDKLMFMFVNKRVKRLSTKSSTIPAENNLHTILIHRWNRLFWLFREEKGWKW